MKLSQMLLAIFTLSLALYIIFSIKVGSRNEIILLALLVGSAIAYFVHLWQKKKHR